MLNLPNILTLFRILLVPILVVVLLTESEDKEVSALAEEEHRSCCLRRYRIRMPPERPYSL